MENVGRSPFSLQGKRILVTGASSGIGREIAIWLSQQGAQLIITARDSERLNITFNALTGSGHVQALIDFLDKSDVSSWLKSLTMSAALDGLVHAAGVQSPMPIRAMSLNHWETLMNTNVTSAFSLIKAFRQKGVCNPDSSVVLLSSVMAKVGQPALLGYCASKGAVESMVRAAALELARESIRINAVAPGVVKTEMAESLGQLVGTDSMNAIEQKHPLGIGTPLDVAYAVHYLLSAASRWVTGTSLVVDGGYLAE
ncbi:SDR family NAD(P)-dependent oxidoreductase [Pseudomonas sp. GV071]|jgi:NAD(P)-dependent dehydrogenase (short-subunit alcohol dehydrogenase family)|uniref:SDR family NAD(P)-dependent oxidoreductase n=1 Tax=Pseudomonas sp. GV071 TaxID=2135754 RepID=UPI000D341456|nr:SDR family oxidoreductase [Pseudomonas sp. GV071]PTQ68464.1 NAD(P)-dependent dehydrogenase (short-subunit alcohol dehydrogenase family) [Pseudomonas sp. GV071]